MITGSDLIKLGWQAGPAFGQALKRANQVLAGGGSREAALAAVAAGVSCGEVDEAARGVLRKAGLAEAFSHSTGHGVGLEIHEPPRIGAQETARLLPGMIITIEPGIYLTERFGIRIEDMVAVTRNGGQVLTPAPKALIEL